MENRPYQDTTFRFTREQVKGLGGSLVILAILTGAGVTPNLMIFLWFAWVVALGICLNRNEERGKR